MSSAERIWDALRLLGVLVTYVTSCRSVRPSADEARRPLPGDELVAAAKVCWKHAITIRGRPAEIWPWLVQMGCRRAGWYSYDGLDNGGVRSAERIVPEFQQVRVGDVFPMAPKAKDAFVVQTVEPERALVLGDATGGMSWAFVLEPIDQSSSRLITRSRGAYDRLALGLFLKVFWHPLDFGMQRRQLLNLKRLAEGGGRRFPAATRASTLKLLVGSGDKIALLALPFLLVGVALNVAYPSAFRIGGPPSALRGISIIVLIAGVTVWVWSVVLILSQVPKGELITSGPFRLVKHPLYTGVALLVLPWLGFVVNTWLGAVVGIILYLGCRHFAPEEETELSATFGAAWDDYCRTVKIPFL
jgi:protein-S-isoprenylcysteine O-methyltransferase Ste14